MIRWQAVASAATNADRPTGTPVPSALPATSSAGTADSNTGDVITYAWDWGDGTPLGTGATPVAHRYAAAGTYIITLTATDGWGKAASTTRTVTRTEPADNAPPTAAFTISCTARVCTTTNGATDPNGDQMTYSWSWGDGTALGTTAAPAHTYTAAGSYTVTLTATDGWNQVSAPVTRSVTLQ